MEQVEMENASAIALKQSPLVTVIGIGTALGGLGLMVAGIWGTWETVLKIWNS